MSERRDVDRCGWEAHREKREAWGLDPMHDLGGRVHYHRARELWDEFTGRPPAPKWIWEWPDEKDDADNDREEAA